MIVAVGQLQIAEGDVDTNARGCRRALEDAAAAGADCAGTALDGHSFLGASRIVDPDGTILTPPLDRDRGHAVATAL